MRTLCSGALGLVATALLALVIPAGGTLAAPGGNLEIQLGPDDANGLAFEAVHVKLDGQPLNVKTPAAGELPPVAIFSGAVAAGKHHLELDEVLRGNSEFFSYVNGYTMIMRGQLDFTAAEGEVVKVTGRIKVREGNLLGWDERHQLDLTASVYGGGAPKAVAAAAMGSGAVEAEAAAVKPVAAVTPVVAPVAPVKAGCEAAVIHFGLDRADVEGSEAAAIERFAACVAGGKGAVLLDGHSDQRGDAGYNAALGERRGQAVAKVLAAHGVAAGRIKVRTHGSFDPVCAEMTEACHARNRRVEMAGP
jgi:peptidoglycan-associated lipoprotein